MVLCGEKPNASYRRNCSPHEMADEIDIEEHDLLDHPQIRNMFPGITSIKCELPSDEEEHEEAEEYLQYDYNLPAETYSVEDTAADGSIHYGSCNPSLTQDMDEYYPLSNKIILGNRTVQRQTSPSNESYDHESEPSINLDEVDLHPEVVLQDWGPLLQNSSCYCRQCLTLFPTENAVDSHKMLSHSLLVAVNSGRRNIAIKSTAKPTISNFTMQAEINTTKKILNQCEICSVVFCSKGNLFRHYRTIHNVALNLLRKPKKISNRLKLTIVKTKPAKVIKNNSAPIHENMYYKCELCSFIYRYVKNMKTHFKIKHKNEVCELNMCEIACKGNFKCDYCNATFPNNKSHNKHLQQVHKHRQNNVKKHAATSDAGPHRCLQCNKTFSSYSIAFKHLNTQHHSQNRKLLTNKLKVTNKIAPVKTFQGKIPPNSSKFPIPKSFLFKCCICQDHFFSCLSAAQHMKSCSPPSKVHKWTCERCKRSFKHYDRAKHQLQHTLTKKFKVFTVQTHLSRRMLCICPDCGLHFNEFMFRNHCLVGCKGEKKELSLHCRICNIDIHSTAKNLHDQYHSQKIRKEDFIYVEFIPVPKIKNKQNLIKRKADTLDIGNESPRKKAKYPNQTQPNSCMPELMKRYKSIPKLWNVLYQCDVCETVTDSYDNTVVHSQNHYNNLENYNVIIKNCKLCHIKFDSDCYERHAQLHKANTNIHRGFFKLLKYSYTSLFKDEWFELFRTITRDQMLQILNKSIYNTLRGVKLNLLMSGTQDVTLYLCSSCKIFVDATAIERHVYNKECSKTRRKYSCGVCRIPFLSEKSKISHEAMHDSTGTNKDSFRIVTFNSVQDRDYNNTLLKFYKCKRSYSKTPTGSREEINSSPIKGDRNSVVPVIPKKETQQVKLYQCQCGLHFISQNTIDKHHKVCGIDDVPSETCSKCGLLFATNVLVGHLCSHHTNTKWTQFEVIKMPKRIVLYECDVCKTNFKNILNANEHIGNCTGQSDGIKCLSCNLIINSDDVDVHTLDHKMQNKPGEFTIKTLKKSGAILKKANNLPKKISKHNTIFRCAKCDLHYLKVNSVYSHMDRKHISRQRIVKCNVCGLRFSLVSFLKHSRIHHKIRKYNLEDLHIITLPKTKDSGTVENKNKISEHNIENETTNHFEKELLHRCSQCNSHFLAEETVKEHDCNTALFCCEFCGLQFSAESLKCHEILHHHIKKCTLDNFDIKTYGSETDADDSLMMDSNVSKNDESDITLDLTSQGHTDVEESMNSEKQTKNSLYRKLITLYKCGECKVYFIAQSTCYKHTYKNHKPLNCKRFVNCQFCGLQFTAASLQKHKQKHHVKEFKLEDVLIEEYIPNASSSKVKLEIYYLNNQSNLVSTTTDVGKSSHVNPSCTLNNTNVTDTNISLISETFEKSVEQKTIEAEHNKTNDTLMECVDDKTIKTAVNETDVATSKTLVLTDSKEVVKKSTTEQISSIDIIHIKENLNELASDNKNEAELQDQFKTIGKDVITTMSDSAITDFCSSEIDKVSSASDIVINDIINNVEIETRTQTNLNTEIYGKNKVESADNINNLTNYKENAINNKQNVNTETSTSHSTVPDANKIELDKQNNIIREEVNDETANNINNLINYEENAINNKLSTNTNTVDAVPDTNKIDFDKKNNLIGEAVSDETASDINNLSNYDENTIYNNLSTNTNTVDAVPDNNKIDFDKKNNLIEEAVSDETESDINNLSNYEENTIYNNLSTNTNTVDAVPDTNKIDFDKQNNLIRETGVNDNNQFYKCNFCSKKYKTKKAKDFHESLDHKDNDKDCPICGRVFNVLILNELHLELKDDEVTCCVCNDAVKVGDIVEHSARHAT